MKMKKAYAAALAAAMVLTAGFSAQAAEIIPNVGIQVKVDGGADTIENSQLTEALKGQNLDLGAETTIGSINVAEKFNETDQAIINANTDIGNLVAQNGEQQTKIDNMQSDMDAYKGEIDTLNGQYSTEYAERVAADADLQSQLDEHKSWIDQANGDISGAIAVNGEQQTQIDDMQSQLDEHKSWIDQANGDISGAIAVNGEQQTQIDNLQQENWEQNAAIDKAQSTANGAVAMTQENAAAIAQNTEKITANSAAIEHNSQRIDALSGRVDDLGGEIDNVGAISAALAGLHPLDYDGTGSKFQLAAAMGSYDGSQAAAIGGFYHFNEDVMMSVGGATAFDGDNKSAFNVGVSFRVGQGSSGKKVNSDDVLAQLNAMNEKIAALEAENQQLSEKVAALEGGEGAEAAEAE